MVKRLKYSCVPVGTGLWIIEAQDTFRRHPMNQKAKSNEEDFAFLVVLSVLVDKAVECRNVIARNRFPSGTHAYSNRTDTWADGTSSRARIPSGILAAVARTLAQGPTPGGTPRPVPSSIETPVTRERMAAAISFMEGSVGRARGLPEFSAFEPSWLREQFSFTARFVLTARIAATARTTRQPQPPPSPPHQHQHQHPHHPDGRHTHDSDLQAPLTHMRKTTKTLAHFGAPLSTWHGQKLASTDGRNLPLKTFTVTHASGSSTSVHLTGKLVIELPGRQRARVSCKALTTSYVAMLLVQPRTHEPKHGVCRFSNMRSPMLVSHR